MCTCRGESCVGVCVMWACVGVRGVWGRVVWERDVHTYVSQCMCVCMCESEGETSVGTTRAFPRLVS